MEKKTDDETDPLPAQRAALGPPPEYDYDSLGQRLERFSFYLAWQGERVVFKMAGYPYKPGTLIDRPEESADGSALASFVSAMPSDVAIDWATQILRCAHGDFIHVRREGPVRDEARMPFKPNEVRRTSRDPSADGESAAAQKD